MRFVINQIESFDAEYMYLVTLPLPLFPLHLEFVGVP